MNGALSLLLLVLSPLVLGLILGLLQWAVYRALVRAGRYFYLAGWPDAELLGNVLKALANRANLPIAAVSDGVRLRRRGDLTFAFNYGERVYKAPASAKDFLLGGYEVGPGEVAIWRA